MIATEGILACDGCEFAAQADIPMCGTVAMRVLTEMDKIGYETISGTERPAEIVAARLQDEPVRRIASVECQLKKLGDASVRLGFSTVNC